MIKRLDNVKIPAGKGEDELYKLVKKKAGGRLGYFRILKKSLDARDKGNIHWLYSVAYSPDKESDDKPPLEKLKNAPTVCVIGSGPSGLCCAVRLCERGYSPVILERGKSVDERTLAVDMFFSERKLDINCNVQFGEGGAGTFSDGKLNTQTKDGYNRDVLEIFARFGAPEEILYLNKPHIGSDKLKVVLKNIRAYIEGCGGRFLFNKKFVGFDSSGSELKSVIFCDVISGEEGELPVSAAVLAVGHSARDTFRMLHDSGLYMEPRDFAVGVRVEHLSERISFSQYGVACKLLPAADYKLVSHAHERTVFTFCMCPGGVVIPAASEDGGVVVNGMSDFARDGMNSNSALMVQLSRADFGEGLFDGMEFQRTIEERAFAAGGRTYRAPCQLFGDFARDRVSDKFGEVLPTYAAGVQFAPLSEVLPAVAVEAFKTAVPDMGRRLKGFDSADALFTGVESRFSSPVRIVRGADRQSVSLKNLYPCGEGSGYSGGITSSAADGIKTAEYIYNLHKNIGNNH
ncbi:MAG TPA: NAD(P)-binding protein [Candidatus Coproplasma stercoripullorum]|uniref:NAD(P)-binding protein n=1 Tax=Candidatus Coproplasma stercoripullorum TaxID=2840751 RepID=A0A9D1DBC4_9FIRM|nr:NAD(P)-binding protein [Candidatus Coproplasma stercoripullorum]